MCNTGLSKLLQLNHLYVVVRLHYLEDFSACQLVCLSPDNQCLNSWAYFLFVCMYVCMCVCVCVYIYRVFTNEWCGFKNYQEIYFSPYTGRTYTVSSGNCPSFSCATSSSLLMLNAGPRGQFPRWRRSRKRLSVCSVLRCPDL